MLTRIGRIPSRECASKNHNPPKNYVLPPGVYEWTCINCSGRTTITVKGVHW